MHPIALDVAPTKILTLHVVDSLKHEMFSREKYEPVVNYTPEFQGDSLLAKITIKNKVYVYNDSFRTLIPASPKEYRNITYGMSSDSKYKITAENHNLWQEDMMTHGASYDNSFSSTICSIFDDIAG